MGWENIEEISAVNLNDELLALLAKEEEYAPPDQVDNRLDNYVSFNEVRRSVCQWNYECVDYFMYDREVVSLSMNYFDRYLAGQISMQRASSGKSLMPSTMLSHLVALTSLCLACKLHGEMECHPSNGQYRRTKLRLQDFCVMSRGTYCAPMLEEMEMSILTSLKWKVHPPTPMDFLMRFVKILSDLLNSSYARTNDDEVDDDGDIDNGWSVFEVARYQTELAVYSSHLSQNFLPSKIALAAMLNAMESRIVSARRTVISSRLRHMFMEQIRSFGGGVAALEEGEDIVEARTILKKLCSKTIVLPGRTAEDPSISPEMAPNAVVAQSTEYELPEIRSFDLDTDCETVPIPGSSSSSPVSVATKLF